MRYTMTVVAAGFLLTLPIALSCNREPPRPIEQTPPVSPAVKLPTPPELMIVGVKEDGIHVYRNDRQVKVVPLKEWQPLDDYTWIMQITPDGRMVVSETTRFGGWEGTLPIEQALDRPVADWVCIDLVTGRHERLTSRPRYGLTRRNWMSCSGKYWMLFETDKEFAHEYHPAVTGTLTLYLLPDAKLVFRRHVRWLYGGVWLPGEKFVYRVASSGRRSLRRDPFFVLQADRLQTRQMSGAAGLRMLRLRFPYTKLWRASHEMGVRPNESFTVGLGRRKTEKSHENRPPSQVLLVDLKDLTDQVIQLPMPGEPIDLSPDGKWLLYNLRPGSWQLAWAYLPERKAEPLQWSEEVIGPYVTPFGVAIQIQGTRQPYTREGDVVSGLHIMVD